MTTPLKTRAFAIFAAALMTLAVFSGTGLAARHQTQVVAANAAPVQVAMDVQHVTIVGHRHHA